MSSFFCHLFPAALYACRFLIAALCIVPLSLSCSAKRETAQKEESGYSRIISFAPSITETIYALSFQDRLAGVTDFCKYPPEVKALPRIGGYVDPNYELILGLKPDLVLLLKEHKTLMGFLQKQSIPFKTINNERIDDILHSFSIIAEACGDRARGDSLAEVIRRSFPKSSELGSIKKPSILLCVGRDNPGTGKVGKLYIAGPRTFYSELIEAAGGKNAYTDSTFTYPSLSVEGIIRIAPDIILDMMSSVSRVPAEQVVSDWNCLSTLTAVKKKQVFGLSGDYITIPGPRIELVLQELRTIIHSWNEQFGTE